MPRDDRLQLRISSNLKAEMCRYVTDRGTTLSELVEELFIELLRREREERLLLERADAEQV